MMIEIVHLKFYSRGLGVDSPGEEHLLGLGETLGTIPST